MGYHRTPLAPAGSKQGNRGEEDGDAGVEEEEGEDRGEETECEDGEVGGEVE